MADQVQVYISAADDLGFEREVMGRAITEIPTSLAWRVTQTPSGSDQPDLEAVSQADVHVLLLASDVRAPVGVEWMIARRTGRLPVLLLKSNINRTQAAQAFIRELERYTVWHIFRDAVDLRKRFLSILADHILSDRERYSLSDEEFTKLNSWLKDLLKENNAKVDETRGGADKSSIIFSTERYVPSEGVLIHNPDQPDEGPDITSKG